MAAPMRYSSVDKEGGNARHIALLFRELSFSTQVVFHKMAKWR
jgi:hypothetical protein